MVDLKVCIGTSCHVSGAHNVIMTFQHMMEKYQLYDKVELGGTFCMGVCSGTTVAVSVNDTIYAIAPESDRTFFKEHVLPLCQ